MDRPETIGGCRKLIRKYGIQFPVLWFGPQDSCWGALDWEIRAVPSAYLIDPQGNILLDLWVDENFAATAGFIMAHPALFAPYGLEWSHTVLPDGSYKLDVHVTSSTHQPLPIKINVGKVVQEYVEEHDGQLVPIDPIPEGKEWNCSSYYTLEGFGDQKQTASFGEFGDATISLTVPHVENAWTLSYSASLVWPGSEHLNAGRGIELSASGEFELSESNSR